MTWHRHLWPAALVACAAGCAEYQTPSGTRLGTAPPFSLTFPAGPQALPGAQPEPATPAEPLGTPLPARPPAADLSGSYVGTAVVSYNPMQHSTCVDYRISGFKVSGDQARFFGFRGTIDPSGEVVMQAGDRWISGRFEGRTFYGQLWRRYPACIWNLTLAAD